MPECRGPGGPPRVLVALLFGALLLSPLAGQEPPAHLPMCTSDSLAGSFLLRVRYLLSATDTASAGKRTRFGVGGVPADAARLVLDEPVCLQAASAYAASVHRRAGLHAPFPMVVVQAGGRYFAQLAGLTGADLDRWDVVVLDPVYRLIATWSPGA